MKKELNKKKNLLWAQTTQSRRLGLGDVALLGVCHWLSSSVITSSLEREKKT
jgi:hypothetical protein